MIGVKGIENGAISVYLKVIRKFFLKTITKVLEGISGITKNIIFFHLKAGERRNFDFCVFLRMCSMPGGRVWPGVTTSASSIQLI